tara:strand:- start:277 stop:2022 length:1746 start_codon:yes stop_codon:yes gene_type:complete
VIKIGLIGNGKWGKILHKNLKKNYEVKFVCNSKDNYESKLKDVDWVVIATPDDTHFKIVRNCILARKNVFCEKPLTPTYEQSKILFRFAKMYNVKLYVNDIQNYRQYDYTLIENNLIERRKGGGGNIANILYRLTYHDIYTIYKHIKYSEIESIKPIDLKNKLHFKINFNDINIEFLYDLNATNKEHHINGNNLISEDNILPLMFDKVFSQEVDFKYNEEISLYTNKLIDKINKKLFKKIAVVGGGIFGCTIAWKLAKNGYNVTLLEKNNDIITQASNINQYRLHKGYHYPRSTETALQSQLGEKSFLKEYSDSIVNGDIEHYYCIAKKDSLVSADQYKDFLNNINLSYEEKKLDFICKNVVDLTVKVNEYLFDPNKLKQICWEKLEKYNVDVILNQNEFESKSFDYVINATYSNLNKFLPTKLQKDYQFELCEKPVIKLPEQYKNKSVVIMDGPFMCIDPLGDSGLHVMGNVVHAIHNTNVGKFPEYDEKFDKLLNKGIVENPSITNIDKFIESAKTFFVDIDKAKHIGSMFTFRTVLPNRDKDDARPTLVENVTDKIFNVFSGKIGTCVSSAEKLMEYI